MFIGQQQIERPALAGAGLRPETLLLFFLGLPLVFVCLGQTLVFIPDHQALRGYVCLVELIFVAAFVFTPGLAPRRAHPQTSVGGWLFLGWFASAVVSVTLSAHPVPALIRHAEWTCHFLFAYTLWLFLQRDAALARRVVLMIPAGFVLTGLYLLQLWFSMDAPRSYDWWMSTPFFSHTRHLGYYALAGLIGCATPLLAKRGTAGRRALALAGLTFCWAFLFWTGGRAALLSAGVGLAAVWWLAGRGRRGWFAGLVVAAAGAGLWLSTRFQVDHAEMGFFNAFVRTSARGASLNGLSTGRMTIWGDALAALQGKVAFGLGPEGYAYLTPRVSFVQPHNLFIQFLLEWGVVGTALFGALLLVAVWQGLQRLRHEQDPTMRQARIVAAAIIGAFTLHSLVDGLYYHAVPLMLLAACFAVVLLPIGTPNEAPSPSLLARLCSLTGLRLATTVLAFLFVAHAAAFAILSASSIPQPHEARARFVRLFPTTTYDLARWIRAWERDDAAAATAWAHWAHDHSLNAWFHYRTEASLLAARGNLEAARKPARRAISTAPLQDAPDLREAFQYLLTDQPRSAASPSGAADTP